MTTPNEILKTYWGYDTFRTQQLEIINSVVEGKDVLAILPTGGGWFVFGDYTADCANERPRVPA